LLDITGKSTAFQAKLPKKHRRDWQDTEGAGMGHEGLTRARRD